MHNVTPPAYSRLLEETAAAGFTMASDPLTGSLLRTLAATKPGGRFLELGTGTGLSTAWILDGMDPASSLVTVDHDEALLSLAMAQLGEDERVEFICSDGGAWLQGNLLARFDFIFADTWHGKYLMLEETLELLDRGGLYIVDDMLPQPNWPEGHAEKAAKLIKELGTRYDLFTTRLDWSTGILICVKR